MNIKLTSSEAFTLCQTLVQEVHIEMFHSLYEYDITSEVLREFVKRMAKRQYPENGKPSSVKLTRVEISALNRVLPRIWGTDDYTSSIICELTFKINQEWTRLQNI